jgi:hypothetical protein
MNKAKVTIDPPQQVEPKHAEAYSEVCDQIMKAVLRQANELRSVTIMRELPPHLQINAMFVGAFCGGVIPMLAISDPAGDDELADGLARQMRAIIGQARTIAGMVR